MRPTIEAAPPDSFDSSRRGSKWEILHIPGNIRPSPDRQPTVNVITSTIEPGMANTLIRQLNRISPLENLSHVKRIQKKGIEGGECQLSIILCLAPESGDIDAIPEGVKNLISSFQLCTSVAKVGLRKCCNLEGRVGSTMQVVAYLLPSSKVVARYLWRHVHFLYLSSNIGGISGFSAEESDTVFHFMKYTIDLATSGDSLVVNAAVIVDPSTNEVIASACDRVYSKHTKTINGNAKACNNCIAGQCQHFPDLGENGMTACLQRNCSLPDLKNRRSSVSCLYPLQWTKEASFRLNSHPLRHAVLVAIELSAASSEFKALA
ncbi:hypothetical protein MLD38_011006 [Melastoma candidum]|uniref:Uncharacterized protein n=1 Tax=Melastoma candidum TaxID=119954 RepID=A0ACB9R1S0_9MYRT|nr:hypothetical protein MLD38_011006 [Melastoma candidum]